MPVRSLLPPGPRAGLRRPARAHRAGRFAVMLPASQVRETIISAYSRSQACGAFGQLARWLVARGGGPA
jgi:hypothetical protein